mmetsp:Transcript_7462/g.10262  ORF Transcript_7462/g.10262 Transcript_7462/m.10262 type:complete len:143 (-) Transcript_7462:381-809(-)
MSSRADTHASSGNSPVQGVLRPMLYSTAMVSPPMEEYIFRVSSKKRLGSSSEKMTVMAETSCSKTSPEGKLPKIPGASSHHGLGLVDVVVEDVADETVVLVLVTLDVVLDVVLKLVDVLVLVVRLVEDDVDDDVLEEANSLK